MLRKQLSSLGAAIRAQSNHWASGLQFYANNISILQFVTVCKTDAIIVGDKGIVGQS
ncbi:MAG: hypothetical protein HRU19_10575 [Pseudobacteriovorax sp.]|nr:hypothetical protein [Pseudobacteriovorax sp.]